MKNILFYKYIKIGNLKKTKASLFELAESLGLRGKILLAKEGINGCLSGNYKDIKNFKKEIRKNAKFSDIEFKESFASWHTFNRLVVKIKKEIITSRFGVEINNKASYIKPKELKKMLDNKEDVVLLDARNEHEFSMGRFRNAISLSIKSFSHFPKQIKKIRNLKNRKIVAYCTGGIRCEKASALLKANGFKDVYQLHGGILNYGNEVGDAHWEGKCFVFDSREVIDIDPLKQKG